MAASEYTVLVFKLSLFFLDYICWFLVSFPSPIYDESDVCVVLNDCESRKARIILL